jgi:hypothetical protein
MGTQLRPQVALRLVLDPPGPHLFISEAGEMPRIMGQVVGGAVSGGSWTAQVQYDPAGAPSAATVSPVTFGVLSASGGVAPGGAFTLAFAPGTAPSGGRLRLAVSVTVDGVPRVLEQRDLIVGATNPRYATLRAFISEAVAGERTRPTNTFRIPADELVAQRLRKICRHESHGGCQFRQDPVTGRAWEPNGGRGVHPAWSSDRLGGVGLFQLTPAPSAAACWDWRENARRGVSLFIGDKLRAAHRIMGRIEQSASFLRMVEALTAARRARRLPPIRVIVPPLTDEQLLHCATRLFNGAPTIDPIFGGALLEYQLRVVDGALALEDETEVSARAIWDRVTAQARRAAHIARGGRTTDWAYIVADYVDRVDAEQDF